MAEIANIIHIDFNMNAFSFGKYILKYTGLPKISFGNKEILKGLAYKSLLLIIL